MWSWGWIIPSPMGKGCSTSTFNTKLNRISWQPKTFPRNCTYICISVVNFSPGKPPLGLEEPEEVWSHEHVVGFPKRNEIGEWRVMTEERTKSFHKTYPFIATDVPTLYSTSSESKSIPNANGVSGSGSGWFSLRCPNLLNLCFCSTDSNNSRRNNFLSSVTPQWMNTLSTDHWPLANTSTTWEFNRQKDTQMVKKSRVHKFR